jgi:hypothetical protein
MIRDIGKVRKGQHQGPSTLSLVIHDAKKTCKNDIGIQGCWGVKLKKPSILMIPEAD